MQFEYLICNLVINNSSVSLAVVNLLNTNTFLVEWTEFHSDFITTTSEVVIVGDLNIHHDNTTHHHTIAMERTALYIVIICYHMLYIVIICYHMQLDLYLLSFILTCVLMYTEPSPMT